MQGDRETEKEMKRHLGMQTAQSDKKERQIQKARETREIDKRNMLDM